MTRPAPNPQRLLAALVDQAEAVLAWVRARDAAELATTSVLAGRDVSDVARLVAHRLAETTRALSRTVTDPATPLERHLRRPPSADALDGEADGSEPVADALTRAVAAISAVGVAASSVVGSRTGAITVADELRRCLIAVVVHADDLSRSLPGVDPVPLVRAGLTDVVRTLAGVLAERYPGRSVEVRVPPFVAVQAIVGPRHTRGTPPNVIETEPLTFLRLAAGRLSWSEAVAHALVRASGNRADLGEQLPIV